MIGKIFGCTISIFTNEYEKIFVKIVFQFSEINLKLERKNTFHEHANFQVSFAIILDIIWVLCEVLKFTSKL